MPDEKFAPPKGALNLRGNRFKPLTWDTMTPAQAGMAQSVMAGQRGSMQGPYNVLLRSPELGDLAQRFGVTCLNGSTAVDHLPLDVKATAFQRKVWQALQQIPRGQTRSYQEIARAIGQPTAARAVARACAGNPVAVAIPCHRVVRADGQLAGYRWGLERKKRLLALERT